MTGTEQHTFQLLYKISYYRSKTRNLAPVSFVRGTHTSTYTGVNTVSSHSQGSVEGEKGGKPGHVFAH